MSQPALPHQLASIEHELGTLLVERLPRGVRATTAGRAVATDARLALAAERVVNVGRAAAQGRTDQLRIACAESMTAVVLPPVLRTWMRRRPGVRISLTELASADALALTIENNEADLAVGPRGARGSAAMAVIGEEEIVVLVPREHRLATASDGIRFAQLADEPIVGYHPSNGLGVWLDEVAARHRVTLNPVVRTRSASTAAQLAGSGLGAALVPTSALTTGAGGALRRLSPPLTRDVVANMSGTGDALVQRFVRDLQKRGLGTPPDVSRRLLDTGRSSD
ncbi:MAG TPA: LysR substrate-binding domain-containing protein [Jatrophihabitantaceae bacterium]|jgi:DNA-binding transcriptional LysR family regulator